MLQGSKHGTVSEPFILSCDEAGEKLTLTDTVKHQLLQQDSIAQWFRSAAKTPGKSKSASNSDAADSGADTDSDSAVDESDADLTASEIAVSRALRKGIDAQPPIWHQPPRLPGKQGISCCCTLSSFSHDCTAVTAVSHIICRGVVNTVILGACSCQR